MSKLVDIYFVDSKTMEVKRMKVEDKLDTYYKLINTDSIEVIARNINGNITQIICDEEGKLKRSQYISGMSDDNRETLVGNLVIKSTDPLIPLMIERYGVLVYSFRR